MSNDYNAEQIQYKEGIEHVRIRPSMYIGDTGETGLHHLIWEVVDNSIDEALGGYCSNVKVTLKPDSVIEVEDNGRGIPVDIHPELNMSALELVMTKIGAGGKFNKDAYKISGGLHGVGVSVVNALSEWCEVYSHREGWIHHQRYERGVAVSQVEKTEETDKRGTKTIFKADNQIFESLNYHYDILSKRLRELAFLNKGIQIDLTDERTEEIRTQSFKFEGGIISFIELLNENKEIVNKKPVYIDDEKNGVGVEIAFQYNSGFNTIIFTYANNINTVEGGTHLSGFKSGMTKVINDSIKKFGLDKKLKENIEGDDTREGLVAVISVKIPEPQFEGQTKGKLGNSEVKGIVESIISEKLKEYFEEHPEDAKKICEKCISSYAARKAAQAKRDAVRKSYIERDSLPGKLADCSEKNPELCELYLVEGDSAGGSAKQGRNREFQAILSLWGKMLNVEKTRVDKVLENEKLQPVIATLGIGVDQSYDYSKLRYHKIIIMADADVDGSHIRTLLLTFFYRFFPELVEKGNIYIAMPPLYKLQIGKEIAYAYNDEEREKLMLNYKGKNVAVQRYKGLGEMNPEQLWETTMNPAKRNIIKITLEDTVIADEIFTTLMGDNVESRRRFIETHAKKVKNLDI